jgi:predicted ATPase with chaperone activity
MTMTQSRETAPASEPMTIAELRVDPGVLRDLALKTLFYRSRMSRAELSDGLKLAGSVVEELMQALSQDGLATLLGASGTSSAGYVYALTQKGLGRAEAALERSGYVGPAPVTLDEYLAEVRAGSISEDDVTREALTSALGSLVLSDETVARIGRAATSRRSTLIYGASGNGKTTAVRTIGRVVGGTIRVPYAIEFLGQIIHLYDASKHEPVRGDAIGAGGDLLKARADRRWIEVRRPVIWAGGELTRQSLELVYDDETRVYEAPLQLKANGGTLIIDDFGRQQMPAVQLLNRWIVALEGGIDHLTMHTGQLIEVPFDVLVLFSTNLRPEQLADEAFLRRIRYKVEIPNPTRDEFRTIFQRECAAAAIPYDAGAVAHLLEHWYDPYGRELRGCHPRDLVEAIIDYCRYERRPPVLSVDVLDEVCTTYFLRAAPAPE